MGFSSIFSCAKGSKGGIYREKKGGNRGTYREEEDKNVQKWRIFSLKELQSATNDFNYDNMLGESRFKSVYKGKLWNGSQIAVKRFKVWSDKVDKEFVIEIEILARVCNKNLLSLKGYCAEGQERLIVYDYMPNLSLHSNLHGQHSAKCLLDWDRRMNIAIGSAEGILYLHHQATPYIIHSDIKASNVLLDSDFQARVTDFGFATLVPNGVTHVTTRVEDTLVVLSSRFLCSGYLAPEHALLGEASKSCDVYSFGILLLELASGKRPAQKLSTTSKPTIVQWALPLTCEGKFDELADSKLNGEFVEEELKRVVMVALVCAQNRPEKRPTMLEVVELLKGNSNEKLMALENNEMFKTTYSLDNRSQSREDDNSCHISEEKEIEEV
ncbi:hypothetical protein Leryth_005163 [Lithospermum erythrorhizon]|nr:hypothetical protein Leryth_005163 [Lithospermum erythrorhizon]